MVRTHQKLVFHETKWKPFFFADLYHFGDGLDSNIPLVYYIGGAGDSKRFEDRVNTEPEALVNEFQQAWEARGGTDHVDLLVSPAPITTPDQRETRLDDFHSFFIKDILPKFSTALPPSIGFVGSAYGSFFATHLAFRLKQCRSLALISGMGMIEACEYVAGTVRKDIEINCYSNDDDEIRQWTDDFAICLDSKGAKANIHRRKGERRFDDYRENSSMQDAFADVLKCVGR